MGGLLQWAEADFVTGLADGASVTTVPDVSGNARMLSVASNKPTYETDIININGYPAIYFNGSRNPLVWTGTVLPKHIFVVAAYEDAQFPADYPGLLSSASSGGDPLVGNPSSTRFFDFDYETYGDYKFRRRDVQFAENNLQAAFNNQISIFEISFPPSFTMDAIQVGKHAGHPTRLWKGYWVGQLLFDRVLNDGERFRIYNYWAMKYRIWPQAVIGSTTYDVYPFAANKAVAGEIDRENYVSHPYSGDPKVLTRGNFAGRYNLSYLIRHPEEFKAGRAFHQQKGRSGKFIFRDHRFLPAEDHIVQFTSPFRDQGTETTFRHNYGFDVSEPA